MQKTKKWIPIFLPIQEINIESLELEEPKVDVSAFLAPKIEDEIESANVSAGTLVCFVSGVKGKLKKDVLNSTLLAQLASNKKYDREKETAEWYAKYREVMENVGWVVSAFDFTKYQASGSTFEVQTVVLDIIAGIASQNALLITKSAIAAIKALNSESKAFKLWDETTHSNSNGNFLVSPCWSNEDNVATGLGCFHFAAKEVDYQFLWVNYSSSSTSLYKGGQAIVLNEEIYDKVRQSVIDKLGDNAKKYVADLEI